MSFNGTTFKQLLDIIYPDWLKGGTDREPTVYIRIPISYTQILREPDGLSAMRLIRSITAAALSRTGMFGHVFKMEARHDLIKDEVNILVFGNVDTSEGWDADGRPTSEWPIKPSPLRRTFG